jgi:hypothetical protein
MYNTYCIYHILGSDYAEFVLCDMGDVTITHISMQCKKCISISAPMQKVGWLVGCLLFYVPSRIFHLYGDVTIAGEGLQI